MSLEGESESDPIREKPQARSKVKRNRILESARRLFARYGFSKTTIEDIARKAGVGKAALYYHFEGKEDVFRSVVRFESDLFLEKLQHGIDRAPDATAKFRAFVIARYQWLSKMKTLSSITHEALEELAPMAKKERERYFEQELGLLRSILSQGVSQGELALADIETSAVAMISGLWGFDSVFMAYGKDATLIEGIDGLIDLMLWGMIPREGSTDQT